MPEQDVYLRAILAFAGPLHFDRGVVGIAWAMTGLMVLLICVAGGVSV